MKGLFAFYNSNYYSNMTFSKILLMCALFFNLSCFGQKPNTVNMIQDTKFDKKLKSLLRFDVPIISVKSLSAELKNVVLLDAREPQEYNIAHIAGAKNIGYDNYNLKILESVPKNSKIVVYCSIGYRSEKIASKIMKLGYKDVSNLYGSIFEWVNQGYPVYDTNEKLTNQIHTYNKSWSKWVENNACNKVW